MHVVAVTHPGRVSGAVGGTFLVVVLAFTVHVVAGILTSAVLLFASVVTTSTSGVVTVAGQLVPMVQLEYPLPFQYDSVPVAVTDGFDPPIPDSADTWSVKPVTRTRYPAQPDGVLRFAGNRPIVTVPR